MQIILTEILQANIALFLLIFTRIGSALISMPGFGEIYVSPRVRLLVALVLSFFFTFTMQELANSPNFQAEIVGIGFFLLVMQEFIIGILIGGFARIIQSALHIAGMIIAFKSSLASAMLFDANQGSQGSVIGNFMTLIGVTLFFVAGLHHMVILGFSETYQLFPMIPLYEDASNASDLGIASGLGSSSQEYGNRPVFETLITLPTADFANLMAKTLNDVFIIAFKISSPMIIAGLVIYLSSGIMGRLMPQMQVFFVIVPAQIMFAFMMLMLILSSTFLLYQDFFAEKFLVFFGKSG